MVHKSQQQHRNHEQSQVELNECWIDSDKQQEYWPQTKQCIHWNRKRNYFTWIYFFISRVNKYCHRRIVSHTTSFKHILFSNRANHHFSLLRSRSRPLSLLPISVCINLNIIFFLSSKKNYHSIQSWANHNIISQRAGQTIGFKYIFFMVWARHHKREYKFRWGRKALASSFNLSVLRCACMLVIKWFSLDIVYLAGSWCTLCSINLLLYFSGWYAVSFNPSISIPFTQHNPQLFIFGIDSRSFSPSETAERKTKERRRRKRWIYPQVEYDCFGICNTISPVSHGLLIQAQ